MQSRAQRLHRLAFLGIATLVVIVDLLGFSFSDTGQIVMLAVGVAVLGIPHGAVDPLLAQVFGVATTLWRTLLFFVVYTLIALLMVGLWLLEPAFTLGGFLALSIWHFRGDWTAELSPAGSLVAAATVVAAPAFFHPEEIAQIFSILTFGDAIEPLLDTARVVAVVAIPALVVTMLSRFPHHRLSALELLSLLLLSWMLPPLVFFVVYFCGLHSPRHIIDSARVLDWRSPVVRCTAVAITVITVAAAAGVYASFTEIEATPRLLAVVFIGLAALTVPHMLLLEFVASRRPSR